MMLHTQTHQRTRHTYVWSTQTHVFFFSVLTTNSHTCTHFTIFQIEIRNLSWTNFISRFSSCFCSKMSILLWWFASYSVLLPGKHLPPVSSAPPRPLPAQCKVCACLDVYCCWIIFSYVKLFLLRHFTYFILIFATDQ